MFVFLLDVLLLFFLSFCFVQNFFSWRVWFIFSTCLCFFNVFLSFLYFKYCFHTQKIPPLLMLMLLLLVMINCCLCCFFLLLLLLLLLFCQLFCLLGKWWCWFCCFLRFFSLFSGFIFLLSFFLFDVVFYALLSF